MENERQIEQVQKKIDYLMQSIIYLNNEMVSVGSAKKILSFINEEVNIISQALKELPDDTVLLIDEAQRLTINDTIEKFDTLYYKYVLHIEDIIGSANSHFNGLEAISMELSKKLDNADGKLSHLNKRHTVILIFELIIILNLIIETISIIISR